MEDHQEGLIMVQGMTGIHLILMAMVLVQAEGDIQEVHHENHLTLMVHTDLHMDLHMDLLMDLLTDLLMDHLMDHHMGHPMGIMEVRIMVIGRMDLDDIIIVMEIEAISLEIFEVGGVVVSNRIVEKIHEEETKRVSVKLVIEYEFYVLNIQRAVMLT